MAFDPAPLLSFPPDTRAGRAGNAALIVAGPTLTILMTGALLWAMVQLPSPSVRIYPAFAVIEVFLFLRAGPLWAFMAALFASFAGLAGLFMAGTPGAAPLYLADGIFLWILFRQMLRLDGRRHAAVNRWEERADRLRLEAVSLSAEEERLAAEREDLRERSESYRRLQFFADDVIGAYGREELVERARRGLQDMFPRAAVRVVFFQESNSPDADDEWGRRALRLGRPHLFPSRQVRLPSLTEGSFLFIPLKIRDSLIGWATLERGPESRPFRLQDLRLAVIAGDLAGLAVGNAERYAHIESLAIADGLTGVFTRGYMDERLQEEFARARHHGRPFSLLLLDLDHFKKVNDTHGHRMGDEVLRWFARQVTAQCRDTDFVARYGGEEFVVLMPNTGGKDALALAQRIRKSVGETPFRWEEAKVSVTVSGGVSSLAGDVIDEKDLLRRADAALYRAKEAGRDRMFDD